MIIATNNPKAFKSFEKFKTFSTNTPYLYDKFVYKNKNIPSVITCKVHGDFLQSPSKHLLGRGCPKCGYIKCTKQNTKTIEQFIQDAKSIHGTAYSYSNTQYVNCKKKVTITCKIHGDFEQTPDAHLNGKQGCPLCSNAKQGFTPERYSSKHAIFYVLKLKNGLYKPGTTTQKSVEKRYNQDNFKTIVEDVIFQISFIDGKNARIFEI